MEDPKTTIEKIFSAGNNERLNRWHYEDGPSGIQPRADIHMPAYMTFPTILHTSVPKGLANRMGEVSEMGKQGAGLAKFVSTNNDNFNRRSSSISSNSSDEQEQPRSRRASTGSDGEVDFVSHKDFLSKLTSNYWHQTTTSDDILKMHNEQKCFYCGSKGHLALSCPDQRRMSLYK